MSKAAATRLTILQQAFALIYRQGYQSTSIDEIIASTQVTKGAFFYHFKTKEEMGLAIINELMYANMVPLLDNFLNRPGSVKNNLYGLIEGLLLDHTFFKVEYGCPTVNMVEEMVPVSPAFRKALTRLTVASRKAMEKAIIRGQESGEVDRSQSAKEIALYVMANYSGARFLGKLFGRPAYSNFLQQFKSYLNNL